MKWYISESTELPAEVDKDSSKEYVYLRKNISEKIVDDVTYYTYQECKIPKDQYDTYEILQQTKADIDYLAMVLDVNI